MVALGAVGEVRAAQPAASSALASDAAAGRDPGRLVAAGAQRRLGDDDGAGAGAVAVALEDALDDDVDVALALRVVRGVVEVVDHLGDDGLDRLGRERARLAAQRAALGDDVRARHAALDRADVRRRLGVQAPQAHRRDGAGGGDDRAAPVLGPDARRGRRGRGTDAAAGRRSARRRRSRRSATPGRRRSRRRRASAAASNALAPSSASSSRDREQQLEPDGRPSRATRPATAEQHGHGGLVVGAEDRVAGALPPAVDEHGLDRSPPPATVSRCAHSSTVGAPGGPGIRASRLPAASSSRRRRRCARSSPATWAATAASSPDGLGMAQSAANVLVEPVGARPRTPDATAQAGRAASAGAASALAPSSVRRRRAAGVLAARRATNSRNSGAGRSGRDLNSGWNCDATKNGWSRSSMTSTRRSSGDVPDTTSPAASSRLRRQIVTSKRWRWRS